MEVMEERTAKLEGIVEQLGIRISRLESVVDQLRQEMRQEMNQLRQEISQDFRWTIGILITMWVSILLTILFKG